VLAVQEDKHQFDSSDLIDGLQEQIKIQQRLHLVLPLVSIRGRLVVSDRHLYFQPFNSLGPKKVLAIRLESISRLRKRWYCHQPLALQVSLSDELATFAALAPTLLAADRKHGSKHSLLFVADSQARRDDVAAALQTLRGAGSTAGRGKFEGWLTPEEERAQIQGLQQRWQARQLSNFEYLMALNDAAGRSFNDIAQYPVMPWVIADYHSCILDLEEEDSFRDLSKPIGALQPARLAALKARCAQLEQVAAADADGGGGGGGALGEQFLFGTHYSTPGYVAHFLVRRAPDMSLHLQAGKFDAADRCFCSVAAAWRAKIVVIQK
jgi:factor associated with neutral sphingomyelinase activation